MTRSTARVLALLELLQAGGIQSVATLATRLGVDERTVRRYVAQLVEMEVPVESVRGRHGGYRVARGYRMPPLMLTDEEALTLLLGLIVGRRSGGLPVDDDTVEGAVGKLRRVLPRRTAARLDALLSSADLALLGPSGRSATEAVSDTDPEVLMVLAEAARDRHPVQIGYVRTDGTASRRTILPYGIVARSGRWYVTGHESRTGEVRTFRVDRISDPAALPGSFHVPGDFDVSTTVLASLAATPWRHEVSVRVAGTVEDLRTQLPAGLATVEPASSDAGPWTRVHLRAERLDWVAPYLAGIGRDLVVEGPAELREHVRALADRLRAASGDDVSDETSPEDRPERPRVRIVHLTGAVFDALAAGDLARANACSPVRLTAYFAGPDWRSTWARRSEQARRDPASTAWVTGVIWDEDQSLPAGRAGFHGPPDADGTVEIGYAVDPAHRRRGYARAALEALLRRARDEPAVHRVRVTIAPGNTASCDLAVQYGFTAVGEQWDDEDGLEIVYEVAADAGASRPAVPDAPMAELGPGSLRAVVFDVGETLVDESRAWGEQARTAGVTPFSLMAAIGSVISRGRDHREAWTLLGVAPPASAPDIESGDLYPDALECLRSARAAGLVVGVAGNQPRGAEAALRAAGVDVDFVAASATWGVAKPSPEFFRRVVDETQVDAHRVLYVGDRLDNDVRPAAAAGLRTAWLRRGPWAHLQQRTADETRPDLELRDLAQLTAVLGRPAPSGERAGD